LGLNPEETVPFPELKGTYNISVPGETRIPGWQIECRIVARGKMPGQPDRFTACFSRELVGDNLKVRARQRGDRFQPLGMHQPKRVGEFMLDARIPRSWRNRVPIIYTPQQIIWVAGWRIDERVKVNSDTGQVICLKMVKLPAP
jgi:tRNA(Ile)-lysidine synthase